MTNLPTGPRMLPIFQLLYWSARPLRFMEECNRRFGEWFTVRFPANLTFVFTTNPMAIKDVFTGKPEDLPASEFNQLLKPILGKNSLLMKDGSEHAHLRRHMAQPFTPENMVAHGQAITEITNRAIDHWLEKGDFDFHSKIQDVTLGVIMNAMFGSQSKSDLLTVRKKLTEILDLIASPTRLMVLGNNGDVPLPGLQLKLGRLMPWGGVLQRINEMDEILLEEISQSRKRESQDGILPHLMGIKHEDGTPLSDQEVRDQIVTLLIAGHEITTSVLSWVFYRILAHPDVKEKILIELDSEVQNGTSVSKQVDKLVLLEAAINETMRLHPVIPIVGRRLKRPMMLGDRHFPEGTIIVPCVYLAHRRSDVWPDPSRFDPSRFLQRRVPPWEFFPFGGGAVRCLGMVFAMYEMKIIVAETLRQVDLTLAPGYSAKAVRRGITLAPSGGLPVIAKKRDQRVLLPN